MTVCFVNISDIASLCDQHNPFKMLLKTYKVKHLQIGEKNYIQHIAACYFIVTLFH